MSEIMNKIYDMITERIGQQSMRDEETKTLLQQKSALIDEIVFRLGAEGEELMDGLTDLSADLETIHDKALFRAVLSLGGGSGAAGSGYVEISTGTETVQVQCVKGKPHAGDTEAERRAMRRGRPPKTPPAQAQLVDRNPFRHPAHERQRVEGGYQSKALRAGRVTTCSQ